jgi:hypothetical protein
MSHPASNRREFLAQAGRTGLAAGALGWAQRAGADEPKSGELPRGRAEHCIFVWLGGGACHIDTWDPKRKGDPTKKQAGSYYDSIATAIPGVKICEHLSRCAPLLDRFNLVRTVHHEVIDEHAAATNRMHTGRPTSGTIVYPSLGSIVSRECGAAAEGVPAYVLIGYPNVTRGPGFLGAKHTYLYLTETAAGPSGLVRPPETSDSREIRRRQLRERMRSDFASRAAGDQAVADYDAAVDAAQRLSGPQFMNVFQLDREPAALREAYGSEFGQRCLLARRLIQSGTRFVEVSHNLNFVNGTGWDTHNAGQLKQHLLIQDLDQALSALVLDLEREKLLDRTLIVVASEFGRPAAFDGGGGRGHHAKAFTVVLAGGGLQNGKAIGETDELGMQIAAEPVSVPDLHATIHWALGIDPAKELYAGDRPVPITDGGRPLRSLFA